MKRILLTIVLGLILCGVSFAEGADAIDKNVINFKLCCSEQNLNCIKVIANMNNEELFVEEAPVITVDDIASAETVANPPPEGIPHPEGWHYLDIRLKFTDNGAKRLSAITSQNIGKRMAIFIKGNLIMAPKIVETITDNTLIITGRFSRQETISFADSINKAIAEKNSSSK
jgi:preprotein translocase subunit SecD